MSKLTEAQRAWLKALGEISGGVTSLTSKIIEPIASAFGDGQTAADPANPGAGQPPFAPGKANDAQASYEEKFKRIEAELQEVISEIPPSPDAAEIKEEIVQAREWMDGAVFQADFVTANTHLDNIIANLAKYRQAKVARKSQQKSQAKAAFDASLKQIQADLDKITTGEVYPNEPLVEKRREIIYLNRQMRDALGGSFSQKEPDYDAANQLLGRIKALLSEYKAGMQPRWKKSYEQALTGLNKETLQSALDKTKWTTDLIKSEGQKVEAEKKAMEAFAAKEDYQQALDKFNRLREALVHFHAVERAQADAKAAFQSRWDGMKAEYLEVMKVNRPEAELQKLHTQMSDTDGQMKDRLRKGDFVAAARDLDQLSYLLQQYKTAEKQTPKHKYEEELAKIRPALEQAVSLFSWMTGPDLVSQQRDVESKKVEMEKAAAQGNYPQALKHLQALSVLINGYLAELRKTPQSSDWVTGTAVYLLANIEKKYHEAAAKLDGAAKAYKDALKAHEDAIKESNSFAREFLIGLFFAGLGGFVGGAVGVGVEKLLKQAKAAKALVDASKDIAKFATRSLRELGGGSPADPLAGLTPLKGDGVDLALSVGKRLHEEAAKLLASVGELGLLLRKADSKTAQIRIDGDPAKALEEDPFLKVLGSIQVDVQTYSALVWIEWAKGAPDHSVWSLIGDIRKQAGTLADLEARAKKEQKKEDDAAERRSRLHGRGA